jgi:preprotein translocase subunit SecA
MLEAEQTALEEILPEAFAMVKDVCRRLIGQEWMVTEHKIVWDMIPYDVQLIGGIILHKGKIANENLVKEKTLVATMPVYLNAADGRGVSRSNG